MSVAVQAYAARQTAQMNEKLGSLTDSSLRIEGHLHRSNSLLQTMNRGIEGIERQIQESNKQLQRTADASEKQLIHSQIESQKNDLRYEQEQREKAEQKAAQETEQNLKDILHQFNRRTQLLNEGSFTQLEKFFFLGQLKETVAAISGELLSQISDKQYRDETEDLVRNTLKEVEASLDSSDREDLKRIEDIEAIDENRVAENLLSQLENDLFFITELDDIQSIAGQRKSITDSDLEEIRQRVTDLKARMTA